jgi:subtilisin family serine protease
MMASRFRAALLPLALLTAASSAQESRASFIGPGVESALRAGRAPVVIMLRNSAGPHADIATATAASQTVQARVLARLGAEGFAPRYRLRAIAALVGDLTPAGLARLARDPDVLRVDLDVPGSGGLTESAPLVRAREVQALGITGKGVTVAVLDTGLATAHADLADDLVDERCFCSHSDGSGCCPGGGREASGRGSAEDDNGHGTNVTGIITSAGRVAPAGIAPDAKIVAVKVIDSDNRFSGTGQVLAGLDYVLTSRPEVRVVNMSLGTSELFRGSCDQAAAFTQAFTAEVTALRARGTLVFAASMNGGSQQELAAPACVAGVVAVGATYDSDLGARQYACTDPTTGPNVVACFSNSGPALDLLAPGAEITSTGRTGTSTYHGTSQATAHASGGAALLLELNPKLSADAIEAVLKATGVPVTDARNGLVFPRIDLAAAVAAASALPTQN